MGLKFVRHKIRLQEGTFEIAAVKNAYRAYTGNE